MPPDGEHMHRPPVLVVSRIIDQLVVEGDPNMLEEFGIVVGFQDFFVSGEVGNAIRDIVGHGLQSIQEKLHAGITLE